MSISNSIKHKCITCILKYVSCSFHSYLMYSALVSLTDHLRQHNILLQMFRYRAKELLLF
jgi:hypothetical protein